MNLPEDKHGLIFCAQMNVCYHEKLELRYGSLINWTSFLSVIFSSAAFFTIGDLLSPAWSKLLIAGVAFAITALNGALLAFNVLGKLMLHTDLKKRWINLLADSQALPEDDDMALRRLLDRFYQLNAEEPAAKDQLLRWAADTTCEKMGLTKEDQPPAVSGL